tara:strand:+ start:1212 stop:1418 length:207 start_codon:yes stop_codon:yes gene_type:complete
MLRAKIFRCDLKRPLNRLSKVDAATAVRSLNLSFITFAIARTAIGAVANGQTEAETVIGNRLSCFTRS